MNLTLFDFFSLSLVSIPFAPPLQFGSRISQIICSNLREFEQVIAKDHLCDPPDQISGWAVQFLFSQVNSISGLSQLPV
jgi:hypothetical protein